LLVIGTAIPARPNTRPTARTQASNRREFVLETAAGFFVRQGFNGTSIRDIAKAAGMLPGSLYYHFPSKEALLVAVFEEGVRRISDAVDGAQTACRGDAWARLEAACEAHLATLLEGNDFAHVVVWVTYHAAAFEGDVLSATAIEVLRSRKISVYRVEVTGKRGESVGGFTGTVYWTGNPAVGPNWVDIFRQSTYQLLGR